MTTPVWGQAVTAPLPDTPGISTSAFLQMLTGLALIVGVLLLGAFLLRRINGGRAFGNAGPMQIVGSALIGPRERIVLLEIGEMWIVVGIVPGQIRTLHTLPRGEIPAAKNGDGGFASWLKQMTDRSNDTA